MSRIALSGLLLLAALTGCTRNNQEFCCTSAADCASVGVSDDQRTCAEGLACVDHACAVPMCATTGCEAAAPVCDLQTDVCGGCTASTECTRFPTTSVCDPASGACVGCVSTVDCGGPTPVCDGHACRACTLDSECVSGACGDNGACIDESSIVYIATTGTDAPPCSRAQPCRGVRFALQETSAARDHIVIAAGTYSTTMIIEISATTTSAPFLSIHGGGSTLSTSSADGVFLITRPGVLRDIELVDTNGPTTNIATTYTFERVKMRSDGSNLVTAAFVNGSVTMRDVTVTGTGCGITLGGGAFSLARGTISTQTNGICTNAPTVVDLVNLLVVGASDVALDLPGVTGSIAFTTVAYTGVSSSTAAAVRCTQSNLGIRSSILWTPTASRPAVSGACDVTASIVGPTALAGNMNADPLLVNPNAGNYHLSGGSPAHDVANTGPSTDFEGDARPKGARFDLGADEGL